MRWILVMAAAGLTGLGVAQAAGAQGSAPFAVQVNTSGSPVVAADRLIPADSLGRLEAFRGRAWWQALAFCAGAWENAAYEAEHAGDAAKAEALRGEADKHFFQPAIYRVSTDRGIAAEAANDVIAPDINFQFLVAADEERPFAEDQLRCRVVDIAHGTASRRAAGG